MKDASKLKDAYVAGIRDALGAEAMAEAGAVSNANLAGKLGMEVGGPQASQIIDYGRGVQTFINDGIPTTTFVDTTKGLIYEEQGQGFPVRGDMIKQGWFGQPGSYSETAPVGTFVQRGLPYGSNADGLLRQKGRRVTNADVRRIDVRSNPSLKRAEPSDTFLKPSIYGDSTTYTYVP